MSAAGKTQRLDSDTMRQKLHGNNSAAQALINPFPIPSKDNQQSGGEDKKQPAAGAPKQEPAQTSKTQEETKPVQSAATAPVISPAVAPAPTVTPVEAVVPEVAMPRVNVRKKQPKFTDTHASRTFWWENQVLELIDKYSDELQTTKADFVNEAVKFFVQAYEAQKSQSE